jgi:hypothetical protein
LSWGQVRSLGKPAGLPHDPIKHELTEFGRAGCANLPNKKSLEWRCCLDQRAGCLVITVQFSTRCASLSAEKLDWTVRATSLLVSTLSMLYRRHLEGFRGHSELDCMEKSLSSPLHKIRFLVMGGSFYLYFSVVAGWAASSPRYMHSCTVVFLDISPKSSIRSQNRSRWYAFRCGPGRR